MSLTGKTLASTYPSLLKSASDSDGIDATTRNITDGEGTASAISLSDDQLKVTPQNDNTTSTVNVTNAGGSSILTVDTTNNLVKVNAAQVSATTAIKDFYLLSSAGFPSTTDTWAALGQGGGGRTSSVAEVQGGTGSTPQTGFVIGTTADDMVDVGWYVPFNITIDSCSVWFGANGASGDTVKFSVMSYAVDTSNGSSGGDLSSGAELCASPSALSGAGYEQSYYQLLTIASGDVAAGRMIVAFAHKDGTNSPLSVRMQLVYHIR